MKRARPTTRPNILGAGVNTITAARPHRLTRAGAPKERFTMKNWIRNKLKNFIFPEDTLEGKLYVTADEDQINEENTLKFSVTPARGGIIVQVRNYDRKRDETSYTTHVIHDDEHVSERVAEIVSMALLRS